MSKHESFNDDSQSRSDDASVDHEQPHSPADAAEPAEENDPRFPTGPWVGFYLQPALPGKHQMELDMRFENGVISGDGRDGVGDFLLRGKYQLEDGSCYWIKRYIGRHDVYYEGYGEGKGIYGKWEIVANGMIYDHGGFRIWPKGMADPTIQRLANEQDLPRVTFEDLDGELLQPADTSSFIDAGA